MKISVGTKITGGFLFVLVLCTVVGVIGINTGDSLKEKVDLLNSKKVPAITTIEEINNLLLELRLAEWGLMDSMRGNPKVSAPAAMKAKSMDNTQMQDMSNPKMSMGMGQNKLMAAMMPMKETRRR